MASSCSTGILKSGTKYTATTALNPTKVIPGLYVISVASDGKEIFERFISLKIKIPVKCHDITNQESTHKNSKTFKISPYHYHPYILLYLWKFANIVWENLIWTQSSMLFYHMYSFWLFSKQLLLVFNVINGNIVTNQQPTRNFCSVKGVHVIVSPFCNDSSNTDCGLNVCNVT